MGEPERSWPEGWDGLLAGRTCPMCAEGRPAETPHGIRVLAGNHVDAYVGRRAAQRGYVAAIWRGSHVTDLAELTPDELAGFWAEVLLVADAMRSHYRPRKINYEVLGNVVPHLHVHITARFAADDVAPGAPLPPDRDRPLPGEVVEQDAAALRSLLEE